MTMIEKIATALFEQTRKHAEAHGIPFAREFTTESKAFALAQARAALEAMREPGGEMVEAARAAFKIIHFSFTNDGGGKITTTLTTDIPLVFRAMIGAALSETGIHVTEQNQAVSAEPHHLADRMG